MPRPSPGRRRLTLAGSLLLAVVLAVAGCTKGAPGPGPSPAGAPAVAADATPQEVAAALAKGLQVGDISNLTFAQASGAQAQAAYATIIKGLDAKPSLVVPGPVVVDGDTASFDLTYTWKLAGGTWRYPLQETVEHSDGKWVPDWSPAVVQPELRTGERLITRRVPATRGEVLDVTGKPIVTERDVRQYGISKSKVPKDWQSSAQKLAKLVGVNAKNYEAAVKGGGPQQFVVAITYRADDPHRPPVAEVNKIPGADVVDAKQQLAPAAGWAQPLLGVVGDATKQIVDSSHGAVQAGDQTGLSGLEQRYDAQLRGTPGVEVDLIKTTTTTPSTGGKPTSTTSLVKKLWSSSPTAGQPLRTGFDLSAQSIAEDVVNKQKVATALVAIDPRTGAIVAAANNDAANGQALATTGELAPGSTFKTIVSLAALRAGMKPSSKVKCTPSITVDGKTFTNDSEFPPSAIGTITLAQAYAYSCNTAFISLRTKISTAQLQAAGASLGVGHDYQVGYPSFFGQISDDGTQTGRAADMIGQGDILMSPMAMAQVAASVQAGHTVLGWVVKGKTAKPVGKPLTAAEAADLRSMMQGVVSYGTGANLKGVLTGGKTGTAEYGTGNPLPTHAWMIGYTKTLAVAVFVNTGHTGSGVAGPLLKEFLQRTS